MGKEKGEGVVVVVRGGVESGSMEDEQGQEAESVTTGAARSAPSHVNSRVSHAFTPGTQTRAITRLKMRVASRRVRYADRGHS